MPTVRIPGTVISVQSASPGKSFGELAWVPLWSGHALGLARFPLPDDLPDDAVPTSAIIRQAGAEAASARRYTAQLIGDPDGWNWRTTWAGKPSVLAGSTVHQSANVPLTGWGDTVDVDVTASMVQVLAGNVDYQGWVLSTDNTTAAANVLGSQASAKQPVMILTYVIGDDPTDDGGAVPNGYVPVPLPRLSWPTNADDIDAVRVEIANAAGTIVWDSGSKPATAGFLDLATTNFAGFPTEVGHTWRRYNHTGGGWRGPSKWLPVTYSEKLDFVLLGPLSTTSDPSPPFDWDPIAGPRSQSGARVKVFDDNDKLIADSKPIKGATSLWTPGDPILRKIGDTVRAVIQVDDDRDRSNSGYPSYRQREITVTLVSPDAATGTGTLTARPVNDPPGAFLEWTGPTADGWQIMRDDTFLTRIAGARDSFRDLTVGHGRHSYDVWPMVDGKPQKPAGSRAWVDVDAKGIWLVNPADPDDAVWVLDEQDGTIEFPEQGVLHEVIDAEPVWRRLGSPPPRGDIEGLIATAGGWDAETQFRRLMRWKRQSPRAVFRLLMGDWNLPVRLSQIQPIVNPMTSGPLRVYSLSCHWQQTGEESLWAGPSDGDS